MGYPSPSGSSPFWLCQFFPPPHSFALWSPGLLALPSRLSSYDPAEDHVHYWLSLWRCSSSHLQQTFASTMPRSIMSSFLSLTLMHNTISNNATMWYQDISIGISKPKWYKRTKNREDKQLVPYPLVGI